MRSSRCFHCTSVPPFNLQIKAGPDSSDWLWSSSRCCSFLSRMLLERRQTLPCGHREILALPSSIASLFLSDGTVSVCWIIVVALVPFLTMGLPGSSDISTDILPMLIINIAMSLGQIKHALFSFMQVIGLFPAAPRSGEVTGAVEFSEDYSMCSGLMLSGLSSETLQALPLTVNNPDLHVGVQGDVECPVCLQEFHRGQEVRVLPFCRHLFHKGCLDRWLEQEQFTCPVCRSSLVPEEVGKKQQQREQEIAEELLVWFSPTHGLALQGLWCST